MSGDGNLDRNGSGPGLAGPELSGPSKKKYARALSLHRLFQNQAAETPDDIAVVFEGTSLTYRELLVCSMGLANNLNEAGVSEGSLVGIYMERSIELVIALLGILEAGGAYVPLDPDYPKERLRFMLQDAAPALVIAQHKFHEDLTGLSCEVIYLDGYHTKERSSSEGFQPEGAAGQLAYVIYTSGSTGKPKGVINTHAGICNRLLWMQDQYRLTSNDCVLQKTPMSFDVSVWEFFWPLICGSRLVLARPGGHRDSAYLVDLIDREQVTVLHFVPSLLRVFLEEPDLHRCRSIRDVICSGEELTVDLQARFFDRMKARLHNLYGPTEAAVDVTFWECRPDAESRVVPIGHPVANTQIYILDEHLQTVPCGEPGELYIGGVQVARGYLNRPELTAERFLADVFSENPEARLYRTGDLARCPLNGPIEYLGRIDNQVKIRGNRIELGEIESVLGEHPSVRQAAVTVHERDVGDRRLIGHIVLADLEEASEEVIASHRATLVRDLRGWLAMKLPPYMVPSSFLFRDRMPLLPNGKLDRGALPIPSRARPSLESTYVQPRTELERRLAETWCRVLDLDQVGIHDRFFELGGDSIRAALFVNDLKKELNEFIYIVTVFEKPTIAEYADFLNRDYSIAMEQWLGNDVVQPSTLRVASEVPLPERRVDADMVKRMRRIIPTLSPDRTLLSSESARNPRAIFVLAPPRSGTTLLRVMLAGHPRLFAATELQLLCFNTLSERKAAFSGRFSAWLEGTIRAIMELKECDADEAKRIMEDYEQKNCTTREFYGVLQDWIGERILVDKTPGYALDLEALRKAENDFDQPFYIHLCRHPYPMVRSFERMHMEQILYLREHKFTSRQLGELVWTVSHQNILGFFENVPSSRRFSVKFENLVQDPREVMVKLCSALELDFVDQLLEPYENLPEKMTDGIYPESTPMGDIEFLKHQRINPSVADGWKAVRNDDFLGDSTWELASVLGYAPPSQRAKSRIESSGLTEMDRFREQRLKRRERRRKARQKSKSEESSSA